MKASMPNTEAPLTTTLSTSSAATSEQVCHSLPGRPGEDVQTVRHGTEDYTSVAAAQTALKVALQPWPTLAGMKSLIEFGIHDILGETYFRADTSARFTMTTSSTGGMSGSKHLIRQQALDRAELHGDGPIVPVIELDRVFYQRSSPRTIAQLNYGLVSGSSSSLSRSSLETQPGSTGGLTLRSRFSVMESGADYSEAVGGDHSDCGIAYGVHRR